VLSLLVVGPFVTESSTQEENSSKGRSNNPIHFHLLAYPRFIYLFIIFLFIKNISVSLVLFLKNQFPASLRRIDEQFLLLNTFLQ
jgi:hypothetical protein